MRRFANLTGQTLHWYVATDTHRAHPFRSAELREGLRKQPSGKTNGLLGKIPLVLGMKVVVSKNFDVEGGVLNGSIGTLRAIRYYMDDNGDRVLKSCVVHIPDSDAEAVPGLGDHEYPVLHECKDWSVRSKNKSSKRRLTIRRTQVPIQPAYAFTCHRAQGQTFSRVVIDLQSCSTVDAAYVMLSRATSLDGVRVLRPFDQSKITNPVPRELRSELLRLQLLDRRCLRTSEVEIGAGVIGQTLTVGNYTIPDAVDGQRRLLQDVEQSIGAALHATQGQE